MSQEPKKIRRLTCDCPVRDLSPFAVATYIKEAGTCLDRPSVKQHLAAIRIVCDWLVVGQVIPINPAASVRGPQHVIKRGKIAGARQRTGLAASGLHR
ncbi:MAG: hypothetical protein KY475_01960 [Planctomycetes bacterium]|nr:hypothetical protein [Planctomycetota bacterium]